MPNRGETEFLIFDKIERPAFADNLPPSRLCGIVVPPCWSISYSIFCGAASSFCHHHCVLATDGTFRLLVTTRRFSWFSSAWATVFPAWCRYYRCNKQRSYYRAVRDLARHLYGRWRSSGGVSAVCVAFYGHAILTEDVHRGWTAAQHRRSPQNEYGLSAVVEVTTDGFAG